LVTEVIKSEEESFLRTIETGLIRVDKLIQQTISEGKKILPKKKFLNCMILTVFLMI
jgi:alanyl-tRNA synthetase